MELLQTLPSQVDPSMAPIELREAIRRLEVKLALSEKSEADAQRQCVMYKNQVHQLEKQLVLRQVADIRRNEGKEDLEELLQEERRRRASLHDELRQLRSLMHSERDEFTLQVEQLKSTLAEQQRQVALLERERVPSSRAVKDLQAQIATLTAERDAADEAYNALYHESNVAMANALEEQEFAQCIEATCASHASPSRRIEASVDLGSVFGSLSAANDAWLAAKSELDVVRDQSAVRDKNLEIVQSHCDRLTDEAIKLKSSLANMRVLHAKLSTVLETKLFELSDAQARVVSLEEQLGDAVDQKDAAVERVRSLVAPRPTRAFATQTTLTTASLATIERRAGEGDRAVEDLTSERIIWAGRIKAAEVKCEALRSIQEAALLPPHKHVEVPTTTHADKHAHNLNAELRSQIAVLHRDQRRYDSTVENLSSENVALRERILRLQSLVGGTGLESSAPASAKGPERAAQVSVFDGEARVRSALDEAAVLRETIATRERQIATHATERQHFLDELNGLRIDLATATQALTDSQSQIARLTQELENAADHSRLDQLVSDATGDTVAITRDTMKDLDVALQESHDVMRTVLQILSDCVPLKHTEEERDSSAPSLHATTNTLLRTTRELASLVKTLQAEQHEWKDVAVWLCDQLHVVLYWLHQGPVLQLLSATNSGEPPAQDAAEGAGVSQEPFASRIECIWLEHIADRRHREAPTPTRQSSTPRRRSPSPYSGATPYGWAQQPITSGGEATSQVPRRTFVESVAHGRHTLGLLLDSIAAQNLEVVAMRRSLYDVKTAFLAEMEAREDLEAQLVLSADLTAETRRRQTSAVDNVSVDA